MAKVTLFVAWLSDFEEDVKSYGISVTKSVQEDNGFMVTVSGDKSQLVNFLNFEYFPGMEDEDKQEILDSIK